MRALLLVIGITLCSGGVAFAQAQGGHKTPVVRQALPRPSPAELRRCALSHKILNATARSACTGYPRRHG
jgi:hypothetical protein